MSDQIPMKSKEGEPISEGDHVTTKFRGGHREGDVEKIVKNELEAKWEDVRYPPKVIFTDQHGHRVNHRAGTLSKTDKDE